MKRKVMMQFQLKLATMLISAVVLAGCGGSSGGGGDTILIFDNFQAASVVVGQVDFDQIGDNQGGAAAGVNTVSDLFGNPVVHKDILYLPDKGNSRVLGFDGIPDINGAPADFVLGQPDFTTTAPALNEDGMNSPGSLSVDDDKLFLSDYAFNRITIYDPVPIAGPGSASVVVGQANFTTGVSGDGDSGLDHPSRSIAVDGKLIVSDTDNNRVMIWNIIPAGNGVAADIVLGQDAFTMLAPNDDDQNGAEDAAPSARTLNGPTCVWSDGTKLVVQDRLNNRVLIWDTFPIANFTPADVVLGQADFVSNAANDVDQDGVSDLTPSASTFNFGLSGAVFSKDGQLFVADHGNNRVLIWDTFPTTNFAPADVVLGQDAFDEALANTGGAPSATTLNGPSGLYVEGSKLIVADRHNHRYLIYEAL